MASKKIALSFFIHHNLIGVNIILKGMHNPVALLYRSSVWNEVHGQSHLFSQVLPMYHPMPPTMAP